MANDFAVTGILGTYPDVAAKRGAGPTIQPTEAEAGGTIARGRVVPVALVSSFPSLAAHGQVFTGRGAPPSDLKPPVGWIDSDTGNVHANDGAGWGLIYTAVPVPTPISISGTPAGTGTVGTAYSFTPTTANGSGAKAFTLGGALPAGMAFNTASGALSGTPTADGVYTLTITVTDSTGSASLGPFSITVSAAAAAANGVAGFFFPPLAA